MNRGKTFRFGIVCFLLFSFSIPQLFAQQALPDHFEEWIEQGRKDWQIPGMAVGIVKDREVIYVKGFGEKLLGGGEPVDANTIFSIASVSKHMTATALAILADEGKITWDDKIIDHIPWFAMKDPWVTREITLRDALTHQVGLGRKLGNRLHFMTNSPRDSVLFQMRYMDLEKPFRTDFVYSNLMYSLAGQVIEYASGQTWDEFLQGRLFKPMEMHSTTTSITQLKAGDNLAYPHQEIDGKQLPIERRNWDNAGPAAGVNASINDLNKWMLMQLGEAGTYNGKTLMSAAQMKQVQSPQNVYDAAASPASNRAYGFGWNIIDYQGMKVLSHGGATDGFNTAMYLMPELELGIVVVGNTFNSFGNALAYHVMDANLGITGSDWHAYYLNNYRKSYERAVKARKEIHDARSMNTQPSLAADAYVGTYRSRAYGKIEVKKKGDDLVLHFWDADGLEATLEHWHYDTFRAIWRNRAQREEFMQFELGENGTVEALTFEFVLRPMLLQAGAYPSNYTHTERFVKE